MGSVLVRGRKLAGRFRGREARALRSRPPARHERLGCDTGRMVSSAGLLEGGSGRGVECRVERLRHAVQSGASGSDRDAERGGLGLCHVQVVVEDDDRAVVDGQGSNARSNWSRLAISASGSMAGPSVSARRRPGDQRRMRRASAWQARTSSWYDHASKRAGSRASAGSSRSAAGPAASRLRPVRRREDSVRRLQPSSVDDDKGGERLLISSLSRHHELGIHPSPHGAPVSAGVTSVSAARSRHFFNFGANWLVASGGHRSRRGGGRAPRADGWRDRALAYGHDRHPVSAFVT